MSEETPKNDDTPKDETPKSAEIPASPPKRRKWRRRIFITLVVLVAVGLIARIAAHLLLGTVIDRVALAYGVNVTFERQEIAVLGGDAGLWFVKVTPKGGGEPILTADYVRGNISIRQLLRGRLAVWRLEADGVDLSLERTADGRIPVIEKFLATPREASPIVEVESDKPATEPGEIDLTSPLVIDALRFNRVRAKLRDRSVTPEFNAAVEVNVRVSDVGSGRRPTKFEINVWSDPLLDSFRIEGEGQSAGRKLDVNMVMTLRGLHLMPLTEYLKPLGLRPTAGGIAMTMNARLNTDAVPAPGKGVQATLVLESLSAMADNQEAAALDKLELKAASIDFTAAKLASLLIDGVRVSAGRSADGTPRFAGIELIPATDSATASADPVDPVARRGAPATRPVAYRMSLDDFRLQNFKASFHDASTSPPVDIAFLINELTSKDVPLDRSNPDATLALAGEFTAPGIVQSIQLDGVLVPYAERKTARLTVRGDGVKLDAVKPYLDALGIQSIIDGGAFTASVDAALTTQPNGGMLADAMISEVMLKDTGELIGMKAIDIRALCVDAVTGRLKAETINISGPTLAIRRDQGGALTAVGFTFDPNKAFKANAPVTANPAPSDESETVAAAPSTQPVVLPRLEIGKFTWKDVRIAFEDSTSEPPTTLQLSDAGFELSHLVIDLESDDAAGRTGTFRAWLRAPNVMDTLTAEGTITPMKSSLAADAAVMAQGLNFVTLAPYLKPLGIEPTLANGTLAAGARLNLVRVDGGVTASALLEKVRYGTPDEELLGLDSLLLSDLTMGAGETTIGVIHIDGPRAKLSRETDGAIAAAGVKLMMPPAPAPSAPAVAVSAPEEPMSIPEMPALPVVALNQFQLSNAAVSWSDRKMDTPVETTLRAGALLSNLTIGRAAPPATFNVELAADGSLDALKIDGSLDASPENPNVRVNVDATGVRAGALAAYLPPGVEISVQDGRFQTSLQAGLSKHPEGGSGAKLLVSTVEFQDQRDANGSSPLLRIDGVNLTASRIDPAGGVIAIEEISVAGLEADALILPDGGVQTLGIILRPVEPDATTEAESPPQPAGVIVATSTTGTSENVADLVDRARKPLPLLTIEKLDLNLTRASVRDTSNADAKPLALADWRLRNIERIELGGKDAESRPPLNIELTGRVDPIVGSVKVHAQAAPFAQQPTAVIDITAAGIRGEGLTDILPQLKEHIDGAQLTDGQFRTHIETAMKFDRRAGDFDLMRGFDLDLHITELAFRNGADGPVLVGLESLQTDGARIQPRTGAVHVKTLEITKPMGYVLRDADGVHVLGWVIKLPTTDAAATATQKGETVVVAETEPSEPKTDEPSVAAAPPEKPAGEIRIDKLLISGIDMTLEDRAVTPVTLVPLTGLDVEVHGLTNMAMVENRPIRFSAVLNAGKVELPKPVKGGGVVGALGDVGSMLGGKQIDTTREMEEREMFSQISASGKISLYPQPMGYVKSSVNGLELASLSGEAAQAGVTLNGGVFDSTVDARFLDDGTIEMNSRFVITDVSVSESENGLISRHLALPAPLDTVIDIMQDADGSITLPVNVPIKQGEVRNIGGAATGAIASVIAAAVASAPVKVVGGVGDMVGLGGEADTEGPDPVIIAFSPGYAGLTAEDQKQIDRLVAMLREEKTVELTLRHELGGGDISRAEIRANPSPEVSLAYARQLRVRKMEMLQTRATLAGKARSDLATVSLNEAQATLDQLRALDIEIAHTEDALDELYDLQRPGADRQASRRTRSAALELGRQRLDTIRNALLAGNPQAAGRVRIINPQFTDVDGNAGGRVSIQIVGLKPKKTGWASFLKIPGI